MCCAMLDTKAVEDDGEKSAGVYVRKRKSIGMGNLELPSQRIPVEMGGELRNGRLHDGQKEGAVVGNLIRQYARGLMGIGKQGK